MARDGADQLRADRKAEETELASFKERLDKLRVAYDRYFMGIDRIPPEQERAKLAHDMRHTRLHRSHNTAIKFQFSNIRQRMTSYVRLWERILRLIEEGKFRRERNAEGILGSMMKAERAGEAAPGAEPDGTGSTEPAAEAPEAARARAVYEAWRVAQREIGRDASVDFESFRLRLEAQKRKHIAEHGWKDVDYTVKVKDGKVALVARPAEDGAA